MCVVEYGKKYGMNSELYLPKLSTAFALLLQPSQTTWSVDKFFDCNPDKISWGPMCSD